MCSGRWRLRDLALAMRIYWVQCVYGGCNARKVQVACAAHWRPHFLRKRGWCSCRVVRNGDLCVGRVVMLVLMFEYFITVREQSSKWR